MEAVGELPPLSVPQPQQDRVVALGLQVRRKLEQDLGSLGADLDLEPDVHEDVVAFDHPLAIDRHGRLHVRAASEQQTDGDDDGERAGDDDELRQPGCECREQPMAASPA